MRFCSTSTWIVREGVNLLNRRFDDISVEFFEQRIFVFFESYQFPEDFKWDEGRFALIAIRIEVVETNLPQNQGIFTGELVLQTEVQLGIDTRVVELMAQMRGEGIRAYTVLYLRRCQEIRKSPPFLFIFV